MATANLGYQSFYQAQLTAGISNTDLTIPLDVVPTPSEGFLVLESTSATKREIIYYTSKTSNSVVCPAGGRGYDGTTAQSHLQNAAVIMAPVAAMFDSMRDLFETTPQGWTPVTQTVSSAAYNGNRSYTLTMSADVSATLSPGMRVRTTRTVTAPTQCTSLNGTTQYYSKTTPTGLSFTTTFTCSAWVKLSSYAVGGIIARRNADTEGWSMQINADGTIRLSALRIALNNKRIDSYQSIPLNKWVHVAATMDVSAGDTTAQKIWIDGVEVPRSYNLTGTATALVQGTTALVVGARTSAGSDPFPGKIAQAAVFSSQLSDATVKSYYSQGLSGTETNLVSAYSFNNSITDLNTTNANNLTAQGSAVATNADSPFSTNSLDVETGTEDYGIVQSVATTTVVVQVPTGNTIPTSGGVSAMSYSTQQTPYGFTLDKYKWEIISLLRTDSSTTSNATYGAFLSGGYALTVPIGNWTVGHTACFTNSTTTSVYFNISKTALTGLSEANGNNTSPFAVPTRSAAAALSTFNANVTNQESLSAASTYVMYTFGATTSASIFGTGAKAAIYAIPSGI
jgi:hypothetical protein